MLVQNTVAAELDLGPAANLIERRSSRHAPLLSALMLRGGQDEAMEMISTSDHHLHAQTEAIARGLVGDRGSDAACEVESVASASAIWVAFEAARR